MKMELILILLIVFLMIVFLGVLSLVAYFIKKIFTEVFKESEK